MDLLLDLTEKQVSHFSYCFSSVYILNLSGLSMSSIKCGRSIALYGDSIAITGSLVLYTVQNHFPPMQDSTP